MSSNEKRGNIGDLVVDCSDLPYLVDLEPGAMRGMKREKEGLQEVLQEIESMQGEYGAAIGISGELIAKLVMKRQRVMELDERIPSVEKLHEILQETRAKEAADCERIISSIAEYVDLAVKTTGNTDLLAKYEWTREYRSRTGKKAAKTRGKNETDSGAEGLTGNE